MTAPPSNSRVAWVTGAAGGLGGALVTEFVAQGWNVLATYHRVALQPSGPNILAIRADVTVREEVDAAIETALQRWGRVDALVNNAGFTDDNACWQIKEEDWDTVIDVNLKGSFVCARAVAEPMRRLNGGHIISVSSFAARQGTAGQSSYAAAKAGLIGLTESLARELGPGNVRVNAVLPGVLRTVMTAKLTPAQLEQFAAANALRRLNEVDEVARFIVFLATMQNVSGQVFQLDSRIGRWT